MSKLDPYIMLMIKYFKTTYLFDNDNVESVINFINVVIKYKIHYKLSKQIIINESNIKYILDNLEKINLFYCNYKFENINDNDKNIIYNHCLKNNLFMDMENINNIEDVKKVLYSDTIHPKYNYKQINVDNEILAKWDKYDGKLMEENKYNFISDMIATKNYSFNNFFIDTLYKESYLLSPKIFRHKTVAFDLLKKYEPIIPYIKYLNNNLSENDVYDFLQMNVVQLYHNQLDVGLQIYKKIFLSLLNKGLINKSPINHKHINIFPNLLIDFFDNGNFNPQNITDNLIIKFLNLNNKSLDFDSKLYKKIDILLKLDLPIDRWDNILSILSTDRFIVVSFLNDIYDYVMKNENIFNRLTINNIIFLTKYNGDFFRKLDKNTRMNEKIYSVAYYNNIKNLRLIGIKNITREMLDECERLYTSQESLNYIKTFEDKLNKNKK